MMEEEDQQDIYHNYGDCVLLRECAVIEILLCLKVSDPAVCYKVVQV
jgi:hypothetical protein